MRALAWKYCDSIADSSTGLLPTTATIRSMMMVSPDAGCCAIAGRVAIVAIIIAILVIKCFISLVLCLCSWMIIFEVVVALRILVDALFEAVDDFGLALVEQNHRY